MRSSRRAFVAVGVDHTTAGIGVRERLAFADAEIPAALQRLTDPGAGLLDQAAILSTCNRVELYGVSRSRRSERQLSSFLARYHGLETSELVSMMNVYRDDEVAHHLAATAAGMHSLVLGETQILGQVRKALEHALAAATAGSELRRLFECAIAAGRRVRSGTAIGRGAASVPYASVELARRRLGTLDQSTALLIGTGDMAQLAAKQLVKRGAKQLLVLGRAPAQARRIAECYGAHAITHAELDQALARSDFVITATSAPRPILTRDQLQRALARRSADSLPLLLIDLSVPRDVDPTASKLPGVEVHTIDDLRGDVARALIKRRAELPEAHAIVRSEVGRFTAWLNRRDAASVWDCSCQPARPSSAPGLPAR
ncbi:MAG TPA: glutamyl-tRNA reductase [Solirubrobacteraceae bacterium]|nr:glutamyl-tRNA reductase [Solirubrobacteraceae bacterium]